MEGYRRIAVVAIGSGLFYIASGALAAAFWNLEGVVVAIGISSALQALLLALVLVAETKRQDVPFAFGALARMSAEKDELLRFAVPAALTGVTIMPAVFIINVLLSRQRNGVMEVAFFTAANFMRIMVLLLPMLLNYVGYSLLAGFYGTGDRKSYRRMFWTNLTAVTITAAAGMLFVLAASPWLMGVFGKDFGGARPAVITMLIETPIEALAAAAILILQTHGRMWMTFFRIALPRDASTIIAALVLVPRYGAAGAGLAFMVGASIALVSTLIHAPHAVA